MNKINESTSFIKERLQIKPGAIGIILGSGLGAFVEQLENTQTLKYEEIPHFGNTTVVGHAGQLVVGEIKGQQVIAFQGRFHLYEGHHMQTVVLPTRVLSQLGCQAAIITNAAGGINQDFHPGDLVLISDHINMMGQNPLTGENFSELGPRFPDMSEAYSNELRLKAKSVANSIDIPLKEGVYAGWMGPSYETPAEIRLLKVVGADLVGMSTVPEVIAANHAGMSVLGMSCVTNYAAGISSQKLNHDEVKEVANRVMQQFSLLVSEIVIGLTKK